MTGAPPICTDATGALSPDTIRTVFAHMVQQGASRHRMGLLTGQDVPSMTRPFPGEPNRRFSNASRLDRGPTHRAPRPPPRRLPMARAVLRRMRMLHASSCTGARRTSGARRCMRGCAIRAKTKASSPYTSWHMATLRSGSACASFRSSCCATPLIPLLGKGVHSYSVAQKAGWSRRIRGRMASNLHSSSGYGS